MTSMSLDKSRTGDASVYGLLSAIIANPGDRATRLILADALADLCEGRGTSMDLDILRSKSGWWSATWEINRWVLYWYPIGKGCNKRFGSRKKLKVAATASNLQCQGADCTDYPFATLLIAMHKFRYRWLCKVCGAMK